MHTPARPDRQNDGPDSVGATLKARYERLARAAEAAHTDYLLQSSAPMIERRHSLPPYNQTYKQRE